MQLKRLQITHKEYYTDKPQRNEYDGKVEFFNQKGDALTIILTTDQLAGIVEICSGAIVTAAKEAAQSIVASLTPALQIEATKSDSDSVSAHLGSVA